MFLIIPTTISIHDTMHEEQEELKKTPTPTIDYERCSVPSCAVPVILTQTVTLIKRNDNDNNDDKGRGFMQPGNTIFKHDNPTKCNRCQRVFCVACCDIHTLWSVVQRDEVVAWECDECATLVCQSTMDDLGRNRLSLLSSMRSRKKVKRTRKVLPRVAKDNSYKRKQILNTRKLNKTAKTGKHVVQ